MQHQTGRVDIVVMAVAVAVHGCMHAYLRVRAWDGMGSFHLASSGTRKGE